MYSIIIVFVSVSFITCEFELPRYGFSLLEHCLALSEVVGIAREKYLSRQLFDGILVDVWDVIEGF